jgi:putative SOS response-associated peptidase YedK
MPVILAPADQALWLAADAPDPETRRRLFAPFPAGVMAAHPVSTAVNDVRNDSVHCLAPVRTLFG